MAHHAVVVTIAVALIYWNYVDGYVASPKVLHLVAPFVFGYLIGDTLFYTVGEAMQGRWEYTIHHVVGCWLIGGALSAESTEISRFLPHLLITECSTFLFGAGMVLRSTSWKTHPIISYLEISFVIMFTLTRIINLPYRIMLIWNELDEIGSAKFSFIPIMALQVFWFYKMMIVVFDKYIMQTPPSKKESSKSS